MVEQRKKWSKIAIGLFVLAVVLAVGNRFMPKPALEVESVVEQYLLTRTLFMLAAAVSAFCGLFVIVKHLRCPHCGAFGLKQVQFCTNCGKDLDAEVVEEVPSEEESKEIEAPAVPEQAAASETAEPANEQK